MIRMESNNAFGPSSSKNGRNENSGEEMRGLDISRRYLGPPDEIEQKIIDTIIEIDSLSGQSLSHSYQVESDNESSSHHSTPRCSPRADTLYLNNLTEEEESIFVPDMTNDDSETITLTPIDDDIELACFGAESQLDNVWIHHEPIDPSNDSEMIEVEAQIEVQQPQKVESNQPTQSRSSQNRKYACEICEKSFVRPAELSRHIRTHTNERPFECRVCHQKFKRNDHLKSHETKHTKIKDHKCTMCSYRTNRKDTLKRHMKNRHKSALGENVKTEV